MYRALIIDDEPGSRDLIRIMLEEYCEGIEVLGEATSVAMGISMLAELRPELVFLDVELPGGDGLDVLEAFPEPFFEVVMVSGHSSELLKPYDWAAMAYVQKPVVLQEFQKVVAALPRLPLDPQQVAVLKESHAAEGVGGEHLILLEGNAYLKVAVADIAYVEAQRNYSKIVLVDGGEHFATYPLSHYEALLPVAEFFRLHRSYLVRMGQVEGYDTGRTGHAHLRNEISLPIAARRKSDFIRRFKANSSAPEDR